jgi:zinc/manganese transport system substrate-binding protein
MFRSVSTRFFLTVIGLFLAAFVLAACGEGESGTDAATDTTEADAGSTDEGSTDSTEASGDDTDGNGGESGDSENGESGERATIAVTTNILGDVVTELVGDQADVLVLMPVGADPHDFQASAQEVAALLEADALIVNGADFEEGLIDAIEVAEQEGLPIYEAIDAVSTIDFTDGHSDHGDEDHDDHDHGDEHSDEEKHDDEEGHDDHDHGHAHDGLDPHFFTDPARMALSVRGIANHLESNVPTLDVAMLKTATDAYVAELEALDAEVEALFAGLADESRVLITNHEVFGYFADRYGFEVVGTVIPSGTTVGGASAGELADLAEVIENEGVPAIFSDVSASSELAETLAAEVGDVAVVELYTESLGEAGSDGGTYLDMVRTNANRIADALS